MHWCLSSNFSSLIRSLFTQTLSEFLTCEITGIKKQEWEAKDLIFLLRAGKYIYNIEHFFRKGPLSTGQARGCFYLQEPVVEDEEGRELQSKKQVREEKHWSATSRCQQNPYTARCSQEQCLPGVFVWGVELSVVSIVIVLPEQPWIILLNLNGGTPLLRTNLFMCVGDCLSQPGAHGCSDWDSLHTA